MQHGRVPDAKPDAWSDTEADSSTNTAADAISDPEANTIASRLHGRAFRHVERLHRTLRRWCAEAVAYCDSGCCTRRRTMPAACTGARLQ